MKDKLNQLSASAMNLISGFAQRGDAASISRIAPVATRIDSLKQHLKQIEQESADIEETLRMYTKGSAPEAPHVKPTVTNGHTGKKRLLIAVDWTRLGKAGGLEVISEHLSSDTMVKWATRLYEQLGTDSLQKLSRFRISRGPMVSKSPLLDYLNKTDGSVYSHQSIADSGYYILTHSQTSQKVSDITKACRSALAFPVGAVRVEETDKS